MSVPIPPLDCFYQRRRQDLGAQHQAGIAPITNTRDFNRDGHVTAADATVVAGNQGTIVRLQIGAGESSRLQAAVTGLAMSAATAPVVATAATASDDGNANVAHGLATLATKSPIEFASHEPARLPTKWFNPVLDDLVEEALLDKLARAICARKSASRSARFRPRIKCSGRMSQGCRASGMATIPETLQTAVNHHLAGRLSEAAAIYRQVLAIDSQHAEATHLLGLVAHQQGDQPTAVTLMSQVINLDATQPFYHNNLGEPTEPWAGSTRPSIATSGLSRLTNTHSRPITTWLWCGTHKATQQRPSHSVGRRSRSGLMMPTRCVCWLAFCGRGVIRSVCAEHSNNCSNTTPTTSRRW